MIVEDLGEMSYEAAYAVQAARHGEVVGWRAGGGGRGEPDSCTPAGVPDRGGIHTTGSAALHPWLHPAGPPALKTENAIAPGGEGGGGAAGYLLLVEHVPPVITLGRRGTAAGRLLAAGEELHRRGVEVAQSDRGGDITYHGPGQLVAYPILDLNRLGLGLHDYMRMLEDVVIRACAAFGAAAGRDAAGTGVWVKGEGGRVEKVCAMGVRVRKWVSMHGLALNVRPEMEHFSLIVPCGLAGAGVTSLERVLGGACPGMEEVKRVLVGELAGEVEKRLGGSRH